MNISTALYIYLPIYLSIYLYLSNSASLNHSICFPLSYLLFPLPSLSLFPHFPLSFSLFFSLSILLIPWQIFPFPKICICKIYYDISVTFCEIVYPPWTSSTPSGGGKFSRPIRSTFRMYWPSSLSIPGTGWPNCTDLRIF